MDYNIETIPEDQQRIICKILSDLDSKIELLQEQNKTLEEIGKAIFKHWFIDFEFPDENGKPYKSSGGEMISCEMGKLPSSWTCVSLINIVKHLRPGTNYQPKRVEGGIPFVNVKNIQKGFLNLLDVKYISEEEYQRVHKKWKPEENDLLITRIGTLGNVGVIREKDLPVAIHYNSIDIKPKDTSFQFLYFLFTSDFFQRQYHFRKKQSVQEYVTIDEVEKIKLFLPKDNNTLEYLQEKLKLIFSKIEVNSESIDVLVTTRNTLLPVLLTGKLRVKL